METTETATADLKPAEKKPHVSVTQVEMLAKCGEQYYRRYVLGEKNPPGIAMLLGGAVHASAELQLKHKAANAGELPSVEAARDWAADGFERKYNAEGVAWSDDERKLGTDALRGRYKDAAVVGGATYRTAYAPSINPATPSDVEWEFRIETPWSHDVVGIVDVLDVLPVAGAGEGEAVPRDTKTKYAKGPPKTDAHDSFQLDVYALAAVVSGRASWPVPLSLDFVVVKPKTGDTHGGETTTLWTLREQADAEVTTARLARAVEIINAGRFMPARPSDWWCSAKWCGYYSTCRFAHGYVAVQSAGVPLDNDARELEARKLVGQVK